MAYTDCPKRVKSTLYNKTNTSIFDDYSEAFNDNDYVLSISNRSLLFYFNDGLYLEQEAEGDNAQHTMNTLFSSISYEQIPYTQTKRQYLSVA